MDHFRQQRTQGPSVGTIWNAAVAIGLLVALWLPMIVGAR